MKIRLKITPFLMFVCMVPAANADANPISETILPENPDTPPPPPSTVPNRRRTPVKNVIHFDYDNVTGKVTFTLPPGVSSVSIVMESEDGEIEYGFVTAGNPIWYVQLKSTTYHLTCVSDSGKSYSADISI